MCDFDSRECLSGHGLSQEFVDQQMQLFRLGNEYLEKLSRWHAGEGEEPAPFDLDHNAKMPQTARVRYKWHSGVTTPVTDGLTSTVTPWFPASVLQQTPEGAWLILLRSKDSKQLATATISPGQVRSTDGTLWSVPLIGME